MKILVLNSGSSSLKFQLLSLDDSSEEVLADGAVERIGLPDSRCRMKGLGLPELEETLAIKNHAKAFSVLLEWLGTGIGIDAIGHRFVHGGELFRAPVQISKENLAQLESLNDLAPLHNPHNLAGYLAAVEVFADVPHVAVFDTAFHHTIPRANYLYGLPWRYYADHKIRRYGFHGSSHQYIAECLPGLLQREAKEIHAISLHLGNGCSVCAMRGGESMDTSMGFTPLEGLLMGTRCGDLDPSLPLRLMEQDSLTINETQDLLNKQSGLLGLSGVSRDLREIITQAGAGNERAQIALDVFCARIVKSIGALLAAIDWRLDALVFTGGIGENSAYIRGKIIESLAGLNIHCDPKKNDACVGGREGNIADEKSACAILIIKANEEIIIARETRKCWND